MFIDNIEKFVCHAYFEHLYYFVALISLLVEQRGLRTVFRPKFSRWDNPFSVPSRRGTYDRIPVTRSCAE